MNTKDLNLHPLENILGPIVFHSVLKFDEDASSLSLCTGS